MYKSEPGEEDGAETVLRGLARKLAKQDMAALKAALAKHIEAMRLLVPTGPDQITPKVGIEQLFERFVDVRREQLGDDGIRRRLARRLQLTRLPDFWGDQEAVEEFEETFFASLALRLRRVGNVPHIAAVFRDELGSGVTGTGAIREVLERHLEEKGWAPANWPPPKQAVPDDDDPGDL